ncbi:tannase/feruloyl esterase family alpha/beta hydrolase [Paraburkholderia acidicola]|uniref:Tannase/feruloyl esterase family alpha/beta hydrolase n=1 Tax=Paraburkholderia acidicola TaxID=1912599 RepID=A0ABV1LWV6_9BURK
MRKTMQAASALTLAACAVLSACGGSIRSTSVTPSSTTIAGNCASLMNYTGAIPATITSAVQVTPGAGAPFQTPTNSLTPVSLSVTTPFCRVTGVIKPVADSSIAFEVWLPLDREKWNSKFMGSADGGSTGVINYTSMVDPLARGYAVMGHDNGHTSTDVFEQSWAFDFSTDTVKADQIIDFGYRAEHVVTVVSKDITNTYFSAQPVHSYYVGCSQGGHHGMMEAQRYPDDYDGIVAGSHGGDWLGMMSSEAWAGVSVLKNNRAGGMTAAQLAAFNRAVISACDAKDGLVDGQIDDPRQCSFDPAILQCGAPGSNPATCLTPAQVQSAKDIYAGPKRQDTGASVSPGYAVGSEGGWATTWNSTTSLQSGSYYDFFRLILKGNPNFDILTLNWDTDIDAGRSQYGSIYDAINPDLSAFQANKSKLIMYHGWADPLISPYLSIASWGRIQDAMGTSTVNQFARLYMVPGMGHCTGGPIGTVDWLTPLENWVEKGIAPDATSAASTIVGSGTTNGVARSRPLCPYPTVEKYKGNGDINSASNFTCVSPS